METQEQQKPTGMKTRSSFFQLIIGVSGMVGLVSDLAEFGDVRDSTYSDLWAVLNIGLVTYLAYRAWENSNFKFRDVLIMAFMGSVLTEMVMESIGESYKVGLVSIGFDLSWIAAAWLLYKGKPTLDQP